MHTYIIIENVIFFIISKYRYRIKWPQCTNDTNRPEQYSFNIYDTYRIDIN